LSDDLKEIREEIVRLARNKQARIVLEIPGMSDWKPKTVNNPEVDMPFTDIGAWHFIADLAESGHPIKVIDLKKPKGMKGYEMIIDLKGNPSSLYIKVHLKGGKIFGRSFHCSYRKF
jgi:hypothetical protein